MKRALVLGLNYTGTMYELKGCVNDAHEMVKLVQGAGFSSVTLMTDDTLVKPTKDNIRRAMHDLVMATAQGDVAFVSYSGHGTSMRDKSGDERDGKDEAICPLDGGCITDDELRSVLVDQMPVGASLFMLLDCCHAGTGADLRYNFEDKLIVEKRVETQYRESAAKVVCLSGCRDDQTSADTVFGGAACGALTAVFRGALQKGRSTRDVFGSLSRELVRLGYTQRAQLSFGRREDADAYEAGSDTFVL